MKGNRIIFLPVLIMLVIVGCKRNVPINEQVDIQEFLTKDISITRNPTGYAPLTCGGNSKDQPTGANKMDCPGRSSTHVVKRFWDKDQYRSRLWGCMLQRRIPLP